MIRSNSERSRLKRGILSILILVPVFAHPAHAGSWGPWSTSPDAPALVLSADREPARRDQAETRSPGIAATPFLWLLTFYQKAVGPVNRGRCSLYPTCSQYSVLAIRKHGPAVGIIMTADRLMHELDEQHYAHLVTVGGRNRFADPVENNDFWWSPE